MNISYTCHSIHNIINDVSGKYIYVYIYIYYNNNSFSPLTDDGDFSEADQGAKEGAAVDETQRVHPCGAELGSSLSGVNMPWLVRKREVKEFIM